MALIPYTILLLLCSRKVQSIESLSGKSNDPFNNQDCSDESFSREFGREKRSNDPNCPPVDLRINNGRLATEDEFPFTVALFHKEAEPQVSDQFCVGILITVSFVLTACHCLVEGEIKYPHKLINSSSVDILAGTTDLNSYVDHRDKLEGCGQVRSGRRIRVHPGCSLKNNELRLDFGMIQTNLPFKITSKTSCMKPVYFPEEVKWHREQTDMMTEKHEACVTMGWGLDVEGFGSALLKVLTVTLRPGKWCEEKILNVTKDQPGGPDIFGPRSSLCALGCEEGETICAGDSGGPLLCGPKRTLLGVVSFGPGNASCGNDTIPFVYARVDGNEYWIWAVIYNESYHSHDSASILDVQPFTMMAVTTVVVIIAMYLTT